MKPYRYAPPSAIPAAGLKQLMLLRAIAVCGQLAAIALAALIGVSLPLAPMLAIVGLLVALNATAYLRLKRGAGVTEDEIGVHLALDLAAFALLVFLSGGVANPFSLLFVLHATLMALLLRPLLAALGTGLVIACFSLLFRVSVPLRLVSGDPLPPALMAVGQWLSLALTTTVVAWFVASMVATLREHDRLLRQATEKAQNDEAILKLGTLAAGAAHELTTPMTTMAVAAGDLEREANSPAQRRAVATLLAQIEVCRQTIANLHLAAGHARAEGGGRERLDDFLEGIAQRCRTTRPGVELALEWEGERPVPEILAEQTLKQAILAILDNAADASPNDVQMAAHWEKDVLRLQIGDRGSGVPPEDADKLGHRFFTTKPPGKGTGLGLVLATSAIRQLSGTVSWARRPGGGTLAEIVLPLGALKV